MAGGTNMLSNVKRRAFSNATLALDIDGDAGQAYRIYPAALNRIPDTVGLGFWINALDHAQCLASVAAGVADHLGRSLADGGYSPTRGGMWFVDLSNLEHA